jgi:hypothetical protein
MSLGIGFSTAITPLAAEGRKKGIEEGEVCFTMDYIYARF